MSKHKQRRERRAEYHRMLDAEIDQEKPFVNRVLNTLNRAGIDTAPDGRPIKADFWRYIASRSDTAPLTAMAGQFLIEKAIQSLHPRHPHV